MIGGEIMQIINALFLKIVEQGLNAGIIILIVFVVRALLKGFPKNFAYLLWIVVAFRLMIPVSIDSGISVYNLFNNEKMELKNTNSQEVSSTSNAVATVQTAVESPQKIIEENIVDNTENIVYQEYQTNKNVFITDIFRTEKTTTNFKSGKWISILACFWLSGILALMCYTIVAHRKIRRKIQFGIRWYGRVYECDGIRSPFVFGIISPKIYLPFRLNKVEQQCILAHEEYHIKRGDYLIKSVAWLLVVVYWFHPLVWVAYHLMCFDMEMSCDEKIIAGFDMQLRKEYSRLMLAFAANKRQFSVSPLAFGEGNTMKRIQNILEYQKTVRWKLAVGSVVVTLTFAACATDAKSVPSDTNKTTISESGNTQQNILSDNSTSNFSAESNISNDFTQNIEDSEHIITHREAQWAENSMFDLEFCSLDYADSDKILFHISSGLFVYDLEKQQIIRSVDLKTLNCQAVQTGGDCLVAVYQNSSGQLKAVITPYPYSAGTGYIYDAESDELFIYNTALLDNYELFDRFVSRYDTPIEDGLRKTWKMAENVLPLGEHSYGTLCWDTIELTKIYYKVGEQKYQLFPKEQATLPKLLKQDDSFYQSIAQNSGTSVSQCLLDYQGLYNLHDYAGVCALSTGVEYSDQKQQEFAESVNKLSLAEEVSHSEDEKEYVFQFSYGDDYGEEYSKVYVRFKDVEGLGWRAEGLPIMQNEKSVTVQH